MNNTDIQKITVRVNIQASVQSVWEVWTQPHHIIKWNAASDDWHTPRAENDLSVGGTFCSRMEAKDGSMGFDLIGKYIQIKTHQLIEYHLEDLRNVKVYFEPNDQGTLVTEIFDAETIHPAELQQAGWQSILNNFKKYVEMLEP